MKNDLERVKKRENEKLSGQVNQLRNTEKVTGSWQVAICENRQKPKASCYI